MKAIILGCSPQECNRILNGDQSLLIRKIKLKDDLPIDVYIYCTKGKPYLYRVDDDNRFELSNKARPLEEEYVKDYNASNGKVVAKFTLNKVERFDTRLGHPKLYIGACISDTWCLENNYHDKDYNAYAWHIDNLEIFDKSKELNEFKAYCDEDFCHCYYGKCPKCSHLVYEDENLCDKKLTHAPKTWCYCEV